MKIGQCPRDRRLAPATTPGYPLVVNKSLAVVILVLAVTGIAVAQDGLYTNSAPEDAALVRIINATDTPATVDVGPLRFRDVPALSASPYRPVLPGIFVLQRGGVREVFSPEAKSFQSVIIVADGLFIIPDTRHTDPARAQLVMYNVTSRMLDFRAVDPQAELVPNVAPNTAALRAVNAISVRVGAFDGDTEVFAANLDLARGTSVAIVVRNGTPSGFVAEATVASE